MKLQTTPGSGFRFTSYGRDYVAINGERHDRAMLLGSNQRQDWRPQQAAELQAADFTAILALQPEVVLLATGDRIRFPHPSLYRELIGAQIGVEVMDIGAACRTFNILADEGRQVIAAILFG